MAGFDPNSAAQAPGEQYYGRFSKSQLAEIAIAVGLKTKDGSLNTGGEYLGKAAGEALKRGIITAKDTDSFTRAMGSWIDDDILN